MGNALAHLAKISSSDRVRILVQGCSDLLAFIEDRNLIVALDDNRIANEALGKVRGALVLAHDYVCGLASEEAVAQVGKEFAKVDLQSKGVLAAAGMIASMVAIAFANNEIPDTSDIIPAEHPLIMDGKRLFEILYGPDPSYTPKKGPSRAKNTLPPAAGSPHSYQY